MILGSPQQTYCGRVPVPPPICSSRIEVQEGPPDDAEEEEEERKLGRRCIYTQAGGGGGRGGQTRRKGNLITGTWLLYRSRAALELDPHRVGVEATGRLRI